MLDNLNLTHMNGRVYDQVVGRFLSADPFIDGVGNTQGWNRYSYVQNRPLSLVDPSGYSGADGMRRRQWIDVFPAALTMSLEFSDGGPPHDRWQQRRNFVVPNATPWPGPGPAAAPAPSVTPRAYPGLVDVDAMSTVGGTGILRPLIVPSGTPTIGLPQYMYEQCSVGMCHGNLALPLERGYYPDEVLRATGRDLGLAVIPIGGWVNLGRAGATRATASVDDLLRMMNRRPNTQAEYASGDMLSYLRINQAEGSHMLLENGVSHIVLRQDVATRRTALHEWLHRRLQRQLGHPRPREDEIIEEFLNRHEQYFRLGN